MQSEECRVVSGCSAVLSFEFMGGLWGRGSDKNGHLPESTDEKNRHGFHELITNRSEVGYEAELFL